MVAHYVRDVGVGRSSRLFSTKRTEINLGPFCFIWADVKSGYSCHFRLVINPSLRFAANVHQSATERAVMIRAGSALAAGNTTGTISRFTRLIGSTVRITGAHIGRPDERFGTVMTARAALGKSAARDIFRRSPARPTASAAATHLHYGKYHCHSYHRKYKYGRKDIHQTNSPKTRYASQAQSQATAHWKNTTYTAAPRPSSRRMAAIAATQGV